MNISFLTGNLTRQVDYKILPTGTPVANFSVAINRFVKAEKRTSFIECRAFGKSADYLNQYSNKGDKIAVTGELDQETWMDKESGNKRSKISIVVNRVELFPRAQKEQIDDIPF